VAAALAVGASYLAFGGSMIRLQPRGWRRWAHIGCTSNHHRWANCHVQRYANSPHRQTD